MGSAGAGAPVEIGPDGTTTSTSQYLIHPPGLGAAKEFLKRAITKQHASSLAAHMMPDADGMADISALQQSAEGQHMEAATTAAEGVPGTATAVADPDAAAAAAAATTSASAEQVRSSCRPSWSCRPTIRCHDDWHKVQPCNVCMHLKKARQGFSR